MNPIDGGAVPAIRPAATAQSRNDAVTDRSRDAPGRAVSDAYVRDGERALRKSDLLCAAAGVPPAGPEATAPAESTPLTTNGATPATEVGASLEDHGVVIAAGGSALMMLEAAPDRLETLRSLAERAQESFHYAGRRMPPEGWPEVAKAIEAQGIRAEMHVTVPPIVAPTETQKHEWYLGQLLSLTAGSRASYAREAGMTAMRHTWIPFGSSISQVLRQRDERNKTVEKEFVQRYRKRGWIERGTASYEELFGQQYAERPDSLQGRRVAVLEAGTGGQYRKYGGIYRGEEIAGGNIVYRLEQEDGGILRCNATSASHIFVEDNSPETPLDLRARMKDKRFLARGSDAMCRFFGAEFDPKAMEGRRGVVMQADRQSGQHVVYEGRVRADKDRSAIYRMERDDGTLTPELRYSDALDYFIEDTSDMSPQEFRQQAACKGFSDLGDTYLNFSVPKLQGRTVMVLEANSQERRFQVFEGTLQPDQERGDALYRLVQADGRSRSLNVNRAVAFYVKNRYVDPVAEQATRGTLATLPPNMIRRLSDNYLYEVEIRPQSTQVEKTLASVARHVTDRCPNDKLAAQVDVAAVRMIATGVHGSIGAVLALLGLMSLQGLAAEESVQLGRLWLSELDWRGNPSEKQMARLGNLGGLHAPTTEANAQRLALQRIAAGMKGLPASDVAGYALELIDQTPDLAEKQSIASDMLTHIEGGGSKKSARFAQAASAATAVAMRSRTPNEVEMLLCALRQLQSGVEKESIAVSLSRFAQNAPTCFPDDRAAQRSVGSAISGFIKDTSDVRVKKLIGQNLRLTGDTSDEDAARTQQAVFESIIRGS